MDTSLERFVHIEDVVRFIKTHLPETPGTEQWQNICTDVLHCELAKVEPILLNELTKTKETPQADEVRELLRAASWYTHPQATPAELDQKLGELNTRLAGYGFSEERFFALQRALTEKQSGSEALSAANAIEQAIQTIHDHPELATLLSTAQAIRDQIYYQLLYPHWFEIVKVWAQTHKS